MQVGSNRRFLAHFMFVFEFLLSAFLANEILNF